MSLPRLIFYHTHHFQTPATQAIFSIRLSVNFLFKGTFKLPGGIHFKSIAKNSNHNKRKRQKKINSGGRQFAQVVTAQDFQSQVLL